MLTIAGGIILALFILCFLPEILAGGAILIGSIIAFIIVAKVIFSIAAEVGTWQAPDIAFDPVHTAFLWLGGIGLWFWYNHRTLKREALELAAKKDIGPTTLKPATVILLPYLPVAGAPQSEAIHEEIATAVAYGDFYKAQEILDSYYAKTRS